MANFPNQSRGGSGPIRPPGTMQQQAPRTVEKVQYFDKTTGLPDAELVDRKAEEQARKLTLAGLKTSQLRRFYEDVTVLQRRIEHEAANTGQVRAKIFDRLRPDFKMLRAKACYAHGRNRAVFPLEFLEFFEKHVVSVNTVEEFDAFCRHFQAVVAFHKYFEEEGKRRRK